MSQELSFDGARFVQELDGKRLTGQIARVWAIVKDEKEHTVSGIREAIFKRFKVWDPENSIQAQLRNLRKPEFGGKTELVESYRKRGGLFVYRVNLNVGSEEDIPMAVREPPLIRYDGDSAFLTVSFVEKSKWRELDEMLRAEGYDYRGHGVWKKK